MQRKAHKKGKCATAYCKNKPDGRYCSTCRSRNARKSDPVRYAYNNLRNNAKRRGIVFTITLSDFRKFCHKVKYIGHSGRSAESYTIDRRHNDVGYHIDNIAVITRSENVKKYFYYDWRTKTAAYAVETRSEIAEDMPF